MSEGSSLRADERSPSTARPVLLVLLATLLGFAGSFIYSQRVSSELDGDALSIATDAAPAIEHLAAARAQVSSLALTATGAVALSDESSAFDRAVFTPAISIMHGEILQYLTLPFYPKERQLYAEVAAATRNLEAAVDDLSSLLERGDRARAKTNLRTGLLPAASRAHAAIAAQMTFNIDQQHHLALDIPRRRARGARIGYVLHGATGGLSLILMGLVVREIRRHGRVLAARQRQAAEHARDVAAFGAKLESIIGASRTISAAITTGVDRNHVFQTIADQARVVANAQYCAVGCGIDPDSPFDPWVFSGISSETAAALGHAPHPDGLLGAVARERRPIRLGAPKTHPSFRGMPPGHPTLGLFLGVPIVDGDDNLANLYLARSPGQPPFSDQDERAAELLAAHVRVAIVNAQLYEGALAATHAREDLLAVVSHDLKNPLNAIRLSAQSLRQRASGEGAGLVALERIERASDRMAGLIGDLLEAAKIEAGALRTDRRAEEVAPLLDGAVDLFRGAATEKSIRLAWEAPLPPAAVLCERNLVLRVLGNLIGNALKFSPEGSSISVMAVVVPDFVQFSVKDNGPGMPAEYLPHAFDRYSQQKDADRRGSGLGLYIAKGIVDAHGGRIWIDSAPGRGTTIHFTLPFVGGREQNAGAEQFTS